MDSNNATWMRVPGIGAGLLFGLLLFPTQAKAKETAAEWKLALRESRAMWKADAVTTGAQPHSVAAWKIAETKSGYATQVASAPLPPTTGLTLAREQYAWSLNSTRFDAAHPLLGALFQEQKEILAGIPASSLHGLLPDTAAFNYYRWRRSLDPARFDHYHPYLGPLLAQDQLVRNLPQSSPQVITPPPIGSTGGGTPGGNNGGGGTAPAGGGGNGGTVPAVPEPAALGLLLIGSGLLLAPMFRKTLARV